MVHSNNHETSEGFPLFHSSIGPGSDRFQLLDSDEDLSQITMSTKMAHQKHREERYEAALDKVVSSLQEALDLSRNDKHHRTPTNSLLQSAFSIVLEAQNLQTRGRSLVPPPPSLAHIVKDTTTSSPMENKRPCKMASGKKLKFRHSRTNRYGSYYGTVNEHGKPDGYGTIIYTSMTTFQGTWHNGRRTIGTYVQHYDSNLAKLDEPIVYQGQFADNDQNKFHGFGTMYVGQRRVWSGQMVDGKAAKRPSSMELMPPHKNERLDNRTMVVLPLDKLSLHDEARADSADNAVAKELKGSTKSRRQQEILDEDEFSVLPSIMSARESANSVVLINLPSRAYITDDGLG